jgi:hypothetical protein
MFSFLIGSEENGSVAKACESQFVTCLRIPLLSTREGGEGWIVFFLCATESKHCEWCTFFLLYCDSAKIQPSAHTMFDKGW